MGRAATLNQALIGRQPKKRKKGRPRARANSIQNTRPACHNKLGRRLATRPTRGFQRACCLAARPRGSKNTMHTRCLIKFLNGYNEKEFKKREDTQPNGEFTKEKKIGGCSKHKRKFLNTKGFKIFKGKRTATIEI
ncbi:hypothetical protein KY289_030400 [Solanum tuberosum]|nr:hypothetical protein KY289_030400 [Solanum tuberosum]